MNKKVIIKKADVNCFNLIFKNVNETKIKRNESHFFFFVCYNNIKQVSPQLLKKTYTQIVTISL